MAVTWGTLRDRARRRYGLTGGASDALLNDGLFLDRVNELLQEFAERGPGFREEFTLNLSGTVASHALDERVRQVVEGTVRIDYDGSGLFRQELAFQGETELRAIYGVVENAPAGVPRIWYMQRGLAAASLLNLCVYPRSDTARTSGLRLQAEVTPTALAADTDSVPVQIGEERHLIPGICLALAETELSRGATGAGERVMMWEARWNAALTGFADLVEDGLRGARRRIHYTDDPEMETF